MLSFYNITAPDEDNNTEQDTLSECSNRAEIHRKTVAQAFWNSEVEMGLQEGGWKDYRFVKQEDREKLMEKVDKECPQTLH